MSRETARAIALTFAVLAALGVLDLVHMGAEFAVVALGVVPGVSMTTFFAVHGAVLAVFLGAKLCVLYSFVRKPEWFERMLGSWLVPLGLVAFAFVKYGIGVVVSSAEAVAIRVAWDRLVARREEHFVETTTRWVTAQHQLTVATTLANMTLWGAVLLLAYGRFRRMSRDP